jgi:hypothetical protein
MVQRDPNRLWYWILVTICFTGVLPVFFLGTVEPLILGIPVWVAVSLISTAVLTVATIAQLRFNWSIEPPVTDPDRRPRDE